MGKFFKNNIIEIVLFVIALVLYLLSFNFFVCFSISCFCIGSALLLIFFKQRKKQIKKEEQQVIDNKIFDATKLDFDEDIYCVGNPKLAMPQKKGKLSKFSSTMPLVIFCSIAVAFFLVGGVCLIKMFL